MRGTINLGHNRFYEVFGTPSLLQTCFIRLGPVTFQNQKRFSQTKPAAELQTMTERSIPTSQSTHYDSITKTNQSKPLREMTDVYAENYTKYRI
jgi:hypothetical protein